MGQQGWMLVLREEWGWSPPSTWGVCSPILILFRIEPKQWCRWRPSCSKGSEVYLSLGSDITVLVRLKLNHWGLSVQFFLSLLHKPYKQSNEHCYAHSLLLSSWHSHCNIFVSVPLFVVLGVFVCLFVFKFIFFNWSPSIGHKYILRWNLFIFSHDTLILVYIYFSLYARSGNSCFLTFYTATAR